MAEYFLSVEGLAKQTSYWFLAIFLLDLRYGVSVKYKLIFKVDINLDTTH